MSNHTLRKSEIKVPKGGLAERQSGLARATRSLMSGNDLVREVKGDVPREARKWFHLVDPQVNTLRTKLAVAFRVPMRVDVSILLALMPPIRLVSVRYTSPERPDVWPVTFQPRDYQIQSQIDLAPFLYTVRQGTTYGPLHEISWVTRLGDRQAVIQAEIVSDPAAFVRVKRVLTPMGRWFEEARWERNKHFPLGQARGVWDKWASTTASLRDAHCTIYWQMPRLGQLQHLPFPELARILLDENREVGHGEA